MAKTWNAEMQERFEKLAETVSAPGRQFEVIERRFDAIDSRFDAIDKRFDDVLRAVKIENENMREYVAKAAEGYGATLERLERTVQEGLRQAQETFALHSRVLSDHAGRMTALERRKKR
jgi:hypothetical protein